MSGQTIASVPPQTSFTPVSFESPSDLFADNDLLAGLSADARDSVKSMEMMTTDLIDYSRGKTNLNLEPVSAADLVRGLERDFGRCRPFIEVRIELLHQGRMQVDRDRLLRVFSNLIRNAREAMKSGEGHELHFVVKRLNSNVRFEISDDGCGIPVHLLPRIFEPFTTHGKTNGTGLGLAISKSVVEADGGTISVLSDEKGTSFHIDLPFERVATT